MSRYRSGEALVFVVAATLMVVHALVAFLPVARPSFDLPGQPAGPCL
jgi:hypothetical protein